MADQITLRAETGRQTGSRVSRRIRRDGGVPAVVYGKGIDPVNVVVDHHDLMAALTTEAGSNALINLETDDETHLTMPRVVERHPFRNQIRHVDFVKLLLTDKVQADVSIHPIGEPVGSEEGGIMSLIRPSVSIEALATSIPNFIELDVSDLHVHDVLRIEDLPELEGVDYLEEAEAVVVTITLPAAEVEPEVDEDAEGVEGEEGEEGEGAGEDEAGESEASESDGE